MSRSRTQILIVTAIAAAVMLLFPPFEIRLDSATLNMGYGFLLSPPRQGSVSASISLGVLVAQWAVLAFVGFVAWIVVSKRAGSREYTDSTAIPATRESQTEDEAEESPRQAESVAMPSTADISGWQFSLGLLVLFLAVVVLRGPQKTSISPDGRVQLLANHFGFSVGISIVGILIAAIGECIARASKRPKTAFRRNALIGAWLFAALAAIGLMASSNRDLATARQSASAAHSPDDRLAQEQTPPVSKRLIVPSVPPTAENTADSVWARPPIGLTPWAKIADKPQYVEGTVAQRAAIRDLYWKVCLVPLILPDRLDVAQDQFLSVVTEIDGRLPPAAQPPSSGRKSLSEYLRERERDRRAAVSADTMSRWCRNW